MSADPGLEIAVATAAEMPVVARLVQLYLHDFSEMAAIGSPFGDVDANGLFALNYFDSYWDQPGRMALLFRVGGHLAGFALINQWSPSGAPVDHSMAEFFVMRRYRRAGIGTQAAHEILQRYRGIWEINVAFYNEAAQYFWRRALRRMPGYRVQVLEGDGERWTGPILRLEPETGAGATDAAF